MLTVVFSFDSAPAREAFKRKVAQDAGVITRAVLIERVAIVLHDGSRRLQESL